MFVVHLVWLLNSWSKITLQKRQTVKYTEPLERKRMSGLVNTKFYQMRQAYSNEGGRFCPTHTRAGFSPLTFLTFRPPSVTHPIAVRKKRDRSFIRIASYAKITTLFSHNIPLDDYGIYGLSCFQKRDPKIDRFLAKNQYPPRNFINSWRRKLTLKVRIWHLFTTRHYVNSPKIYNNWGYWFLDKKNYLFLYSSNKNSTSHITILMILLLLQSSHRKFNSLGDIDIAWVSRNPLCFDEKKNILFTRVSSEHWACKKIAPPHRGPEHSIM